MNDFENYLQQNTQNKRVSQFVKRSTKNFGFFIIFKNPPKIAQTSEVLGEFQILQEFHPIK